MRKNVPKQPSPTTQAPKVGSHPDNHYHTRTQIQSSEGVKRSVRTTVFLDEAIGFNLDYVALKERRSRTDLIREAVFFFLKEKKGIPQPDRLPDAIELDFKGG